MFEVMKTLFYTFVAVVVGVFIGTVPIEGRTISDRIVAAFSSPAPSARTSKPVAASSRPTTKAAAKTRSAPVPAKGPVTAGAANSPDQHSSEDRAALEKVIAARRRN